MKKSPLEELRAKSAPLEDRLAQVDQKLAEPVPADPTVDEELNDRKARNELSMEREIVLKRLTPLREEIASLEAEEARVAAEKKLATDVVKFQAAFGKLTKAREAAEAEVAAIEKLRAEAIGGKFMPPEIHFAGQEHIAAMSVLVRRLDAALH